jgi:hypothetical protein
MKVVIVVIDFKLKNILPLRISVSTHGFGPCGSGSIPLGVTKMVIWSSGLGAGLQTQLGGFDSYYHLNGFGGNPRVDDESMSTKMPRGQGPKMVHIYF